LDKNDKKDFLKNLMKKSQFTKEEFYSKEEIKKLIYYVI
jgi:hypothetical protein